MFEWKRLKIFIVEMQYSFMEVMLQMSKSMSYENLYIAYRAINNTQVQRTDLTIVEMDRIAGTWEDDDKEDIPNLWYGNWEKESKIY